VLSGSPAEVLTEANIRRFFEAEVEVLDGASGLAVSPVRRQDVTARYESKVRA
jgi:ABC-type cobalamin/Fe3+-siderophores transport system ATPase subunit